MTYSENKQYYHDIIEKSLGELFLENDLSVVQKAMRYSLMGKSKRVRGTLSLACCELVNCECTNALPVASAVEVVHTYSLIHDDLPCMDNDDIRRGNPSCHIAFGEAIALLAGDALLTSAFEILTCISDLKAVSSCILMLSKAIGYNGMIYGQELDILATEKDNAGKIDVDNIHKQKTGKLITASAVMGALVGGGSDEDIKVVEEYADRLGVVFQIIDDILDITANKDLFGKPLGSDEREGKMTFVSAYGFDRSKETANNLTKEAIQIVNERYGNKAYFLSKYANELLSRSY